MCIHGKGQKHALHPPGPRDNPPLHADIAAAAGDRPNPKGYDDAEDGNCGEVKDGRGSRRAAATLCSPRGG
ncbi:hypothetical protein ACOMHN_006549 [Nucella lapillus]